MKKRPGSIGNNERRRTVAPQRKSGRHSGRVLFLIFLLMAVGIAGGGAYYYRQYALQYRQETERQLNAVARLKTEELSRFRQERLADAAVLYRNETFSALVRRYFGHPEDRENRDRLAVWLGHIQKAYGYHGVMLLDPRHVKRVIIPERPERPLSQISPASADLLKEGRIAFEDFYRNEEDGRIYLKILIPVFEAAGDDRILGIVALRIDPELSLYPFIRRWPTPSETAETLLIRREGKKPSS